MWRVILSHLFGAIHQERNGQFCHHKMAHDEKDEIKDRPNYNGLCEKAMPSYGGRDHLLKALGCKCNIFKRVESIELLSKLCAFLAPVPFPERYLCGVKILLVTRMKKLFALMLASGPSKIK
jgi:hypothetical protein